jgi:SAM-dependent methyltransferase
MGDVNQLLFVKKHAEHLYGPYLEVGARDYGSTQDLQPVLVHGGAYTRVDMQAGRGVDVVLDLAGPFDEVDACLGGARFGTIFCLSVLEHCEQPFGMAENLTRLLAPGGKVCVSVPFAWQFHGYPSDYWRFTHEGVKRLFPRLTFEPERCAWATPRKGDFRAVDRRIGRLSFGFTAHREQGHLFRGLSAKILGLLPKLGLLRWLAGHRYVLAPTNLLMIGESSDGAARDRAPGH